MKLPQLSLRELFWLVLVCAMGLGWFSHFSMWMRARRLENEVLKEFYESLMKKQTEIFQEELSRNKP